MRGMSAGSTIVRYLLFGLVILFALACLYPFLLMISASFTAEFELVGEGLRLLPRHLSTNSYRALFYDSRRVIDAYAVTITVTVLGTVLSVLVTSLMAYPMSRRDLRYRGPFAFYVFFTMLFNGGMLPWYIVCVRVLHLRNTLFALILPYLVNAWFVFLLKNYFQSLPAEMAESAKIDGAGEVRILFRIIYPLSKPALAVVVLFIGLMYWNDWWLGIMLIENYRLRPLQLMLRAITSQMEFISLQGFSYAASETRQTVPKEGAKYATTVITIGPIIFLYPFLQRYFVKGIIMGALKG